MTYSFNDADLKAPYGPLAFFLDLHPDLGDFKSDVIDGFSRPQKSMSPMYFYDEHGSKLFNQITGLDEYYPTRTERAVFSEHANAITEAIGPGAAVFEYGSGSSEKIEWLLNGLENPVAYVAMDISKDHLIESASALAEGLDLPVAAVCADFHASVPIPKHILPDPEQWLGFFPGSTIGNMTPQEAQSFLDNAAKTLGAPAKLLVGVDLEKDKAVLQAAYDDSEGVTAEFNLNLLRRMKRELGADITLEDFEHLAIYNEADARIEMHLRARRATTVTLDGAQFDFAEGETLHTENSHKFTLDRLKTLIAPTPWRFEEAWTDPKGWYAACLLSNS